MFKFKSMSVYVRNVVDPLFRASVQIFSAEHRRLRLDVDAAIATIRNELKETAAELNEKFVEQTKVVHETLESFSTIEVGWMGLWPFHSKPGDIDKWLWCDGSQFNPDTYPKLFKLLGAPTLPDYRSVFIRGWGKQTFVQNNGSTIGATATTHASAELREIQGDALRPISGKIGFLSNNSAAGVFIKTNGCSESVKIGSTTGAGVEFNSTRVSPTDNEIRPINSAFKIYIRALD